MESTYCYPVKCSDQMKMGLNLDAIGCRAWTSNVGKRWYWTLACLALLSMEAHAQNCQPRAADLASAGGPACAREWMDQNLKLNDLLVVGTHNSYKQAIPAGEYTVLAAANPELAPRLDYAHKSLQSELDAGARQLELDVARDDPQGGRFAHPWVAQAAGSMLDPAWIAVMMQPGLKAIHMPGVDFRSSCPLFRDCLQQLLEWSHRHPDHVPILVLINAKDAGWMPDGKPLLPFDAAGFDQIDAEIRSVLPPEKLIVPDDVQGSYPTLREAVLANAWPRLRQARGKFLFALDENPRKVAVYRGDRPSLEGRVLFVRTDENSPAAAYMTLNDSQRDAERIAKAVRDGFLVRTRADADTMQARVNDTPYRDQALASGAQSISTDYLWADPRFPGGFNVRLPSHVAALCNPLRTGTRCAGVAVESVSSDDWQRAEAAPLIRPELRVPMIPAAHQSASEPEASMP